VITTRIRIQILLKRRNNYYLLDSIGKRVACALVKTFNSRKINKIQQINLIHSQKDSNFNTHVNKSQQTQFPDSNKSHEFSWKPKKKILTWPLGIAVADSADIFFFSFSLGTASVFGRQKGKIACRVNTKNIYLFLFRTVIYICH